MFRFQKSARVNRKQVGYRRFHYQAPDEDTLLLYDRITNAYREWLDTLTPGTEKYSMAEELMEGLRKEMLEGHVVNRKTNTEYWNRLEELLIEAQEESLSYREKVCNDSYADVAIGMDLRQLMPSGMYEAVQLVSNGFTRGTAATVLGVKKGSVNKQLKLARDVVERLDCFQLSFLFSGDESEIDLNTLDSILEGRSNHEETTATI